MKTSVETTTGAWKIRHGTDFGFLPHVWLHRRGARFYQESSYSFLWFFGVMLAAAIVLAVLPWDIAADLGGKLKYWLAGFCVWGGICTLAGFFVRNAIGQTIVIDPQGKTVRIKKRNKEETLAWQDVIGVQVVHYVVPDNSNMSGWRLNLVWKDDGGAAKHHCLLQHAMKRYPVALAKRYQSLFGFAVLAPSVAAEGKPPSDRDVSLPHPH